MKKIITITLMLCMLFSITYAYNLTKIVRGNKIITAVDAGTNVGIMYVDVVGYTFNKWIVTGITLADETTKSIGFAMPSGNVTIEAIL